MKSLMRQLAAGLGVGLATALLSAAPPATQPAATLAEPSGAYEVHEWVLLVCDPHTPTANAAAHFGHNLPPRVGTSRPAARGDEAAPAAPFPAGLLVFHDQPGHFRGFPGRVDVLVQVPRGRAAGTWPQADGRHDRLLWKDLALSAEPPEAQGLLPAPQGHWFEALRSGPSLYLAHPRGRERFLLYDVMPAYTAPLRVTAGTENQLRVSTSSPLRELHLYRPAEGGWRTATAPPASPVGQELIFAPAVETDAARVVQPWVNKLSARGLTEQEAALAVASLAAHALDRRFLTAVYLLDSAELDRILPLQIVPVPTRTVRLGLVIARRIDPALEDEIGRLVQQLGHPQYRQREAAQQQLAELGPAARTHLEAAQKDKDPEIVMRVEQLLEAAGASGEPPQARARGVRVLIEP